jgi:hypothetical protein
MVAVLDTYARREAQSLIDQYGDLALACAQQRERDAAAHDNANLVGLWEIVAFYILCLRPGSFMEPGDYILDLFRYFQ